MSKYLKEGEAIPFGYGFVAHRYDMLAIEVSVLPINYLIRAVRWWQMKSYRKMTRDELRQLRKVQAIVLEAKEEEHRKDMKWFMEVLATAPTDNKGNGLPAEGEE